jgi:cytochrome b
MNLIRYRVWDFPTRLFHGLLIVLLFLQWASAEWSWLSMTWHFRVGYLILGLLVFRILWGFLGSESARFGAFVRGPKTVLHYMGTLLERKPEFVATHNPLGAWAVVVLLFLLLVQTVTGFFTTDDIMWYGPYAEKVDEAVVSWMTVLHKQFKNLLLVWIGIHLLAIGWHAVVKRENLSLSMITGDKPLPQDPQLLRVSVWRFLWVVLLSAGIVCFLVILPDWL